MSDLAERLQISADQCEYTVRSKLLREAADEIKRLHDREAATVRGLNALKTKYPTDLCFANTGFTLGVIRCVIDAALSE